MIKFTKPKNVNGTELCQELQNAGVYVEDPRWLVFVENDDLFLNINETDAKKAEEIVKVHNGTITAPEPTFEEKLSSLGLNVDELKAALGLQ